MVSGLRHDPEQRAAYLRKVHRAPLKQRAENVLGEDGSELLRKLREAHPKLQEVPDFDKWVRNILRKCGQIEGKRRKRLYVEACISRHQRIGELQKFLDNNPDPTEILDSEELRTVDKKELKARSKEIRRAEDELKLLTGEYAYRLLCERIGSEKADLLAFRLSGVIVPDLTDEVQWARVRLVLNNAAKPTTKHPEKYIARVIENERAKVRRKRTRKR